MKKQIKLLKKYGVTNYEIVDDRIVINDNLELYQLTTVEDKDFLKNTVINGNLEIYQLTTVEDKDFLKNTVINGSLDLARLGSFDKDFLKNTVINDDLNLDSLKTVEDKDFLKNTVINGQLYLDFSIFNGYESREFLQETTHVDGLIRIASICGNINAVKALLKNPNVDPTINDNEALKDAFYNKHWKVVELLLMDDRIRFSNDHLYRIYKREIMRMYKEGEL